jgi:rare lipoprotein A
MHYGVWNSACLVFSISLFSLFCADLSGAEINSKPSAAGELQSGVASIYDESSGKQTASGEPLHEYAFTGAHRTLPFGTVVQVTNSQTGSKTLVRINDRGPFVRGRIIDLTPAAARALEIKDIGHVSLEIVSPIKTDAAYVSASR